MTSLPWTSSPTTDTLTHSTPTILASAALKHARQTASTFALTVNLCLEFTSIFLCNDGLSYYFVPSLLFSPSSAHITIQHTICYLFICYLFTLSIVYLPQKSISSIRTGSFAWFVPAASPELSTVLSTERTVNKHLFS